MRKIKTIALFAIIILLASCEKDSEPTSVSIQTKQIAYIQYEIGDSLVNPSFMYRIAIIGDTPFDEVRASLDVILKDSTRISFNQDDLVNIGQMGFYCPDYPIKKYWIFWCSDPNPISYYNLTESDVVRFEYRAQVRIQKRWYAIPLEGRRMNGPIDPIWI